MHGLILAGGEGSRLAADGIATPKALAEVAGEPQLVALAERFAALGCTSITCLLREGVHATLPPVVARRLASVARVVSCHTPSSLHTLVAGLDALPSGAVFCSLVDTVMADDDWRRVHTTAGRALANGADTVLAITPPSDDDAPLWVQLGAGDAVAAIGTSAVAPTYVTGGVYAFAPSARTRARTVLATGRQRMRAFLTDLVDVGADVRAVRVARIIDVDHAGDLAAANAYLATTTPSLAASIPPTCR